MAERRSTSVDFAEFGFCAVGGYADEGKIRVAATNIEKVVCRCEAEQAKS